MRRSEKIERFLESRPRATVRDLQDKFALTRKEAAAWLVKETPAVKASAARAWWQKGLAFFRSIVQSEKKFVLSLVVLTVSIRLAYLFFWMQNEALRLPILDAEYYREWARAIVSHGWLGDKIFFTEPLYAYGLAVLLLVFGEASFVPVAIGMQFVLGALFPVLLFRVGQFFLTRKIGLVAGLLAALYGPFVFYEGLLLKTSLEVYTLPLFLLAAFAVLERPRRWHFFLMGILLGALSLVKGNTLIFVPVILGLIFLFHRGRAWQERWWLAGCFVVGVILCLLPTALRNYHVGHDIVPTNYSIGLVLYQGSWWGGDGSTARVPDFLRPHPRYEELDAVGMAEAYAGKTLLPSEVSRFWMGKSLQEIVAEPGHFLANVGHKALLLVNYREYSDNYSYAFYRSEIPLLWILPGYFFVIVCGAAGLLMLFSRVFERVMFGEKESAPLARFRRARLVLLLCFVAYVAVLLLTTINSRYRMPLVPFLILFSASGIVFLLVCWRERTWEGVRRMGALGLVVALLALLPLAIFKHLSFADAYQNIGYWYFEQGDLDKAETSFREAIAEDDEYAWAYRNLTHIALKQGKLEEAASLLKQLILIRPDDLSAYAEVALLKKMQALSPAEAQGALEEFLEKNKETPRYDADFFEASRFLERGDDAQAEALFTRSLERQGNSPQTLIALASLRSKKEDTFAAKRYLRQALEDNPSLFPARYNLANIFIREENYSEVAALLGEVYQFTPELGEVWYNYAVALIKTGKTAEAAAVAQGYVERYRGDAARAEKVKKFEEALKPKNQSLEEMVKQRQE